MVTIPLLKDISKFNNTSDYLPIINGCVTADLIIIFLVFHGVFRSKYLKKWYTTFQLSAVLADTLILVIGIIIARFFYKNLFNEFNIWKFTGLAVVIQIIHDILFYLFFTPFYISNADLKALKNKKSIKSTVGISPTMVLLFPVLFFY
jgi:uncharacterized protein YacL